jgi:hypothetical protein
MIDTMEDPAIRFRLKQREMMRRRAHKQGVLIGCAFGWMSVVGAGPPAPCAPLPQGASARNDREATDLPG